MQRIRGLIPALAGAAMLLVPGTALADWRVLPPAVSTPAWYQYPVGAAGSTFGGGTAATGGGTAATGGGAPASGGSTGLAGPLPTGGLGDAWFTGGIYNPASNGAGTAAGGTGTAGGTGSGAGTQTGGAGPQTGTAGTAGPQTGSAGTAGTAGTQTGSAGTAGPPTAGSVSLTPDEQQLFDAVNRLRLNHGLNALALNPTLVALARAKARDMVTHNYFGHNSPTLGTPYQMQVNAGLRCRVMGGENIAGAADISRAIFMFETSPDHMANILYPAYTETGVGVVADGPYGVFVAQEFVGGC